MKGGGSHINSKVYYEKNFQEGNIMIEIISNQTM